MIKQLKFFNRLHWKFITIYMLLILIAMQVIGAYFIKALEAHYVQNFTRLLEQQASIVAYSIQNYMVENREKTEGDPNKEIHNLIEQMISSPHIEIQVLDQNGIVISTSTERKSIIGQRNTQIEVKRALQGTRDETVKINPRNGHRVKILSLPIKVNDEVGGALFLMASMEEMYQTIKDINQIFATGTFIAVALTAGLGVTLSRTITSPIKEMTNQATAMASGDFSQKVQVYGQDEIGQLAHAFNFLTNQLSKALSVNEEEKKKLSSILTYMSDGVIAVNRKGEIILMNPKAEMMLHLKEKEVMGAFLPDIFLLPTELNFEELLNRDQQFLMDMQSTDHPFILQVNVTPLKKEGQQAQGIIAVLQDVTNQEKMEKERKDFVANVSHELRTPLTTMKTYLEALEDGVIKDPILAPKFIQVTQNETERMIRLVNDLLQLSQMDKKMKLNRQELDLKRLIEDIVERFSVQSKQRELKMELDIDDHLPLMYLGRDQMIQVFDNLISNAIKYSYPKKSIYIHVRRENQEIAIAIQDEGIGIPSSDLKHIFKRFYRVDKARSRDMGGTGLGLSIAREMIIAHNGTIVVESEYGQGTTVLIRIPIVQDEGGKE